MPVGALAGFGRWRRRTPLRTVQVRSHRNMDLTRFSVRAVAGMVFASGMPTRSYTRGMSTDRITADPARMAGAPTIRNTRVTVTAVLGQLAAGRTIDEILADYPYLEREDILAVLEFATESIERELPITAA